jgi:hypothetical protein
MQDADLFLELGGIAGVFVGFGALIAVRTGGGPTQALEVAPMRVMVAMGVMAVIAALAPVTISRYGPTGQQVWELSSGLVLVCWLVLFTVNARTPEWREGWATSTTPARTRGFRVGEAVEWAVYAVYMIVSVLTPLVIVLGLAPDLEAALYFTVVVLILLGAAWSLLGLVYMPRSPASA